MDNRIKQYLFDIENSIEDVEIFMATIQSFEEYEKDKLIKRAVEREIEIIGEAMNRILKIDPEISIPEARKIVNTRNKIIHAYDEIDDVVIYVVATKHLASLKKHIADMES
ncbi:MAG: HepT-like ribonuclease domain-containing protein [Bacteroidota bacterium]